MTLAPALRDDLQQYASLTQPTLAQSRLPRTNAKAPRPSSSLYVTPTASRNHGVRVQPKAHLHPIIRILLSSGKRVHELQSVNAESARHFRPSASADGGTWDFLCNDCGCCAVARSGRKAEGCCAVKGPKAVQVVGKRKRTRVPRQTACRTQGLESVGFLVL
ncbi:hypothetical protein CC86DRAFT_374441 [Ophiobolus disseminans]|uniref:Uncharacterized protein n=1 Tax=Ophiobolus disseminans TaxID=1469910 RepID=A0A6A6ZJ30_9PLEO|nr:hypothetical protein CC86DRAFT_374441 [Ophiobolus disseminans]